MLAGKSLAQTSWRRKLPVRGPGFLPLSRQRNLSVPGRDFLEEVLPHPVNARAELVGEFGEPQNGVTDGGTAMLEETRDRKGSYCS